MKLLFTVLDGAAGRPNPDLNGKTALESAETPNLDKLASTSEMGMMTVIPETAPESDSAVISLLGYDPREYYTGRGPLEALGAGMRFQDGDLALRCNFATLKNDEIVDRRVARSLTEKEALELEKIINEEVELTNADFKFKSTLAHRGALIIKSEKDLGPHITNTDPAYGRKGLMSIAKEEYNPVLKKCKPLNPDSETSAELVNEFTEKTIEALKDIDLNRKRRDKDMLEANAILTRDAGNEKPKLPDINERFGLKWTILANMPLERGIAKAAGMNTIKVEDEENYSEWIEKTLEAMKDSDALYIHLKGPDLPGHDGDAPRKKRVIEKIDKEFYGKLMEKINLDKTLVSVTSDHSTPCTIKAHSSDPVPVMASNPKIKKSYERFNEKTASESILKFDKGPELMPYLIKLYGELER